MSTLLHENCLDTTLYTRLKKRPEGEVRTEAMM